jgi:UDP-N-acetylglucosamine--N-acetylmuramyl-(pentapeptide) pyrophosphoryl-undecaprenol N-acetylglucosamine transferase
VNIAIAGGGTAGHVVPALALAHALDGDEITFIGTAGGAEARLVPQMGFSLETIDVAGFDRARPLQLPAVGLRAVGAARVARKLLARKQAEVCVGMGGYVSLPVCYAARSLGIPVVLHEQNIVFGLANRMAKPIARVVALSFEQTLDFAGENGVVVGNPVAPELAVVDVSRERERGWERFDLDPIRKTVLVFGGSQGSRRINEAAAGLAEIWTGNLDLQVLHIAGSSAETESGFASGNHTPRLIYRMVPYVERMVEAYAVADLALCRGGATTVAELCAVGLPAIIVPYPHHRDRQQERLGRVLEDAGAAVVLDDSATSSAAVAELVDRLLADDGALEAMSKAAVSLSRPDAALRLATLVREAAEKAA